MRVLGILALSVVLSLGAAGLFAKKAAARNGSHTHSAEKRPTNPRDGGAPEPATVLLMTVGATVAAVKKVRSLRLKKSLA
jgi:hypothetical protein